MKALKAIILILAFQTAVISVTNVQTQKTELVVQTGHTNAIAALAFSPDGKLFATAAEDKTFKLWDTATKQELRTLIGHTDMVRSIAFSPDGKSILSGGGSLDDSLRLWNIETGEQLKIFPTGDIGINTVGFSPDGKKIWSASVMGLIQFWNPETGEKLTALAPNKGSYATAFSPDGKLFASADGDDTISFWETQTFQPVRTIKDTGFTCSIDFAPDSKTLLGHSDNIVKIWSAETGETIKTFTGHAKDIKRLMFSSDGSKIISAGEDNTIRLWNTAGGNEIGKFAVSEGDLMTAAISPDGKLITGAGADGTIRFWDARTAVQIKTIKGNEGSDVRAVAISGAGDEIASGSYDGTIKLWSSGRNQEVRTLLGHTERVVLLRFSPDGKTLVSVSADKTLRLWDTETAREIKTITGYDNDVIFSPDGKTVISPQGKNIKLWNARTGEELKTFKGQNIISALSFSADGHLIAGGEGRSGNVRLWNAETGEEIKNLPGRSERLRFIAFSPDGKMLAVLDDWNANTFSGNIELWNVESGSLIKTLKYKGLINSLAFSTDGKMFVTSPVGVDDKVNLWDVESGKITKSFDRNAAETVRAVLQIAPDFYKKSNVFPVTTDERFQIRAAENGKIIVRNVKTGADICSLVAFSSNDWLVAAPSGLFDGTPAAWRQVIWRLDNNTFNHVPVDAFFKEFYSPGLLGEVLQGTLPPAPAKDLSAIDIRQPSVKITQINNLPGNSSKGATAGKSVVRLRVEVEDNSGKARKNNFPASGGAQDLRLFRNGSLIRLWEKDVFALGKIDGCRQLPAAKSLSRAAFCETNVQITAGKNEFSAYAFNHDDVKSADASAEINGAETLRRKGKLNILAVGINEYQNKNYNLNFAKSDAIDFGAELRRRQIGLNDYEAPNIISLIDAEATKQNFLYALERYAKGDAAKAPVNLSAALKAKLSAVQKTQPEDILVIYFAGHGTAYKSRFYLIPTDGFPLNPPDEETRINLLHRQSISDLELEAVLRDVDAGELMLVIDACNSGQALESEEKRRGPMNSKGLAQLAFEKGMYILTAAQSYQAALEISRTPEGKNIEHGLLTYSLLQGMLAPQADADADKKITEREWFAYAAENVPRMQLEEMQKRSAELKRGDERVKGRSELAVATGDNSNASAENRRLQTPRVFYRRESSSAPFIVGALQK